MAFLFSLMQILRQSTERAIAHVRPPGPIKHGGVALWNQRFAHASSLHCYAQPASATIHVIDRSVHHKVSDRPLVNLFNSIVEHAITPVFRGIKTEHSISHRVVKETVKGSRNYYIKPDPAKGIYDFRGPKKVQTLLGYTARANNKASRVTDVGLKPAWKDFIPFFEVQASTLAYTMAPSLGLRAAVDELEDQTQNWRRQREKKKPKFATSSRCSSQRSSLLKKASWNLQQKMVQADSVSNCTGLESLLLSEDFDFSDSCSSSYLPEKIHKSDCSGVSDFEDSDGNECFRPVEQEPIHTITTLNVPMSPEIFQLLIGHPPIVLRNELNFLDLIQGQSDGYERFRLRVLRPLERALQDGYLAQLEPQGWNAGQLEWGTNDDCEVPYLPITFNNRTRQEVLEMLLYDVEPDIYRILQDLVLEIPQPQDDFVYPEAPRGDPPDENMAECVAVQDNTELELPEAAHLLVSHDLTFLDRGATEDANNFTQILPANGGHNTQHFIL